MSRQQKHTTRIKTKCRWLPGMYMESTIAKSKSFRLLKHYHILKCNTHGFLRCVIFTLRKMHVRKYFECWLDLFPAVSLSLSYPTILEQDILVDIESWTNRHTQSSQGFERNDKQGHTPRIKKRCSSRTQWPIGVPLSPRTSSIDFWMK